MSYVAPRATFYNLKKQRFAGGVMTARTHPGSKDDGSWPHSGADSESVADQLTGQLSQRIQRRRLRQQVRSLVQSGAYTDAIACLDELVAAGIHALRAAP